MCYAGRAGTRIRLEALHRMLLSDAPPRFARERVPTTTPLVPFQGTPFREETCTAFLMLTRPALPVLKNAKAGAFAYWLENQQPASV